jgi:hypothetical protein
VYAPAVLYYRLVRRAVLVLVALTAVAALGAGAAAARAPETPAYAHGLRAQPPSLALRAGMTLPGFTGGAVTASDGETVNLYVDDALLAADPATPQRWADFMTSLLHGAELATVTLYVGTLDHVRETCGSGALGCYGHGNIVAPGQDVGDLHAESIVMHEYGHHVANSRSNAPWRAVDWGTKRWASYLNVCARSAGGQLFPGDEDRFYQFNPGEAFAEDYRVVNERNKRVTESTWQVVSESLYPDQAALDLLAQDVTSPWTRNSVTTFSSTLGPHASGRGFRVATQLDGTFTATLRVPARARLALRLVDPATGRVVAAAAPALRVQSVSTSVCGQRMLQVQVKRLAGAGTFTLAVSKP